MTRPRVLHVYKDYWPPVVGGIEKTINLMAAYTKEQFDVRVLVNSGSWGSRRETIDGIPVRLVGEWGRIASAPISPGFPRALAQEAREADIIHLHHPNPTGDLAYVLSGAKCPVVMTYHSDVVRQRRLMRLYGPLQEKVMSACTYIMPTSPDYLESSPYLARHRDRCRIVPLAIEQAQFSFRPEWEDKVAQLRSRYASPSGHLIVFTGRLRYYKGLQYLISALPMIIGSARVLVGGDGKDRQRLQNLAHELNVSDRIDFLGDLTDEELAILLHSGDLFCMPSHLRSEAFGLSQVEAMACGLPVVSTNLDTGVRFVNQDGVTGYTVPKANPKALADAINRILKDDALRTSLGTAARQRAARMFSAPRLAADVMAVYRDALRIEK